ncbi:MAG: homoserine O-acetyltransferase [Pseudomonadales bacterium]|jgi:homoserine O-acetyltransferase|tara:strand:+ start:34728 stop:35912 length:1185 start_codon:yes stop_codon:yes gene_type:complete
MTQSKANSLGVVEPRRYQHNSEFWLQNGEQLHEYELVFETYGTLNADKSNAILICHALSGHHHAAGFHALDDAKPGWWDACIGPGKCIDTDQFFVLSLNNLGGCHGSTGPNSIDPNTGEIFGPSFPNVVVKDWVASQAHLADHLGIKKFVAVVGGSLGGMQAMQWSIDFPERVYAAVLIASAAKLSAQNIAFNEIARQAITTDEDYCSGNYQQFDKNPEKGLMLARMVGHVTYLSEDGMKTKFGRDVKSGNFAQGADVEFQVESYLHYQGRAFTQYFDANTYLLMTRALDYFDPAREFDGDLTRALEQTTTKFLVLSFSTDWRFSPERSQEIVDALIRARKNVASAIIESEHGHDSFLLPINRYTKILSAFLQRSYAELEDISRSSQTTQGDLS